MRAEAQVLKGHLDTLLLASLDGGPRHGYAVKEALRAGSGARFDLPTGTIYPALRRLEAGRAGHGHLGRDRRAAPPHLRAHPGRAAAAGGGPGRLAELRLRGDLDPGASAMTTPLIAGYVAGLHRKLPAGLADEAADGLAETYQQHLASGAGEREAALAALAEFGDLATVVGEFTRQAPGRRAARLLLATGPAAGGCWAAALILGRAWTWPVPATVRIGFGAALLVAVLALLAAATSRHSYQRTRLAAAASPVILLLDATAVAAAAALAAPSLTPALGAAVAVSLGRIAFTAWTLPRLAAR
jgi:Transcriptional regulator PadR-like family